MKKVSKFKFILKMSLLFVLVLLLLDFGAGFISTGFTFLITKTLYGSQLLLEILWFLIMLIIISLSGNWYVFKNKKHSFKKTILCSIPFLIIPISFFIGNLLNNPIKQFSLSNLFTILFLTIFVGLFEEFLCRGWIQNEFIERFGNNRKNVLFSIIISSIFFGLMHFGNLVGQSLLETLLQVSQTIFLGIFLGCIYYKYKNIWAVAFLHFFYDFCLMISEAYIVSTCKSNVPEINSSASFAVIFIILFYIFYSAIILNKKSINELVNEKEEITIKDQKKAKRIKIFGGIYITFIIIILFLGNVVPTDEKLYDCSITNTKSINKYEEHYIHNDKFNISSIKNNNGLNTEFNFNIYLKDNKLYIKNAITHYEVELEEDIEQILVFKNNNTYNILFIVNDKYFNTKIYYSNYLTDNNIDNSNNCINSIKKSFKKIELPNVSALGYITQNNVNYPLFITETKDYYILDNNITYKILK